MIVTFFSNFLNHHQLPFCKEMYARLGDDFKFVATKPISKERLNMGYHNMNKQYSFVLTTYDSRDNYNEAIRLGKESDIVIHGSAPEMFFENRIKENKLTFRYSERIFKTGRWHIFSPRTIISLLKNHTAYIKKNLYMLCASGYTASDFALVGAYINKTYKWGYFPEVKKYDLNELFAKKNNDTIEILWAGRFLKLKHPEKAILVAEKLKKDGYEFKLNMIGNGELIGNIKTMIKEKHLEGYVELLGSMPPENVREHMENANIFLFTSDYNEGWGAVLNESMNSGCAVVASHAIGSVPFLIKHNVNGLVYKNNDINDLYNQVKSLMDNESLRISLGRQAYLTLKNTWNAKNAASNFLELVNSIMQNKENKISDGPCSKAKVIMQGNMYKSMVNK